MDNPTSPRRTVATAQMLYHRFHLHFPLKAFAFHVSSHSLISWLSGLMRRPIKQDVSLAALLVASKLEDTLKKLREIQIAGWQIINIVEGGLGTGEGDATVSSRLPSGSRREWR